MEISNSKQPQLLRINEAAEFLKVSKSYLYKLTSLQLIPFYKPSGKLIYFKKQDLIEWALRDTSEEDLSMFKKINIRDEN